LSFWGDLISGQGGQRSKAKPKTCFNRFPIYLLVLNVHLLRPFGKSGVIVISARFSNLAQCASENNAALHFRVLWSFKSKMTLGPVGEYGSARPANEFSEFVQSALVSAKRTTTG
jgi:hypothetical protein